MVLAASDGHVQRQRTYGVESRSHKQVQVDLFPRSPRLPRQHAEHAQEGQIFHQIEQIVVRTVDRNIEHDILVREHDEGV